MPDFDPLAVEYTFHTDEGVLTMPYSDYLATPDLRAIVNDKGNYARIIRGRDIVVMSRERMRAEKKPRDIFTAIDESKRKNGIMYFAPCGPGPTGFLNDTNTDIKVLMAGNQRGKTATGIIDDILDLIPTEPSWPIFSKYGVKHRPWRGPIMLCILTYKWPHQKDMIWRRIKEWMPAKELGEYATGERKVQWASDQRCELACGSEIVFRVYSQDQDIFEGPTWTRAHWDEQGIEAIFDGVDERVSTQGWKPTHSFTLTPHVVEGRPDTGGGSWIEKLITGENTKGKEVSQYLIHPDHVPDWIYPEAEKAKKYQKWIKEPAERGDFKTLREGRSRFYGEWHVGGGLVYDEWLREVHMIEPFDVPVDWTHYRAIDHGTRNPTVCLYGAMSPQADLFIYDEYYAVGKGIPENVKNIIEQSGNTRRVVDRYEDELTGEFLVYYEEVFETQEFQATVLDPRSFKAPDPKSNKDLSRIYKQSGLAVKAATAHRNLIRIPKVKTWLAIDYNKKHPVTGNMGRPRVFVFSKCVNFIREIESRQWKKTAARKPDETPIEVPEKKNDHTQNSFEYMIWIPPRYYPPGVVKNNPTHKKRRPRVRSTAY